MWTGPSDLSLTEQRDSDGPSPPRLDGKRLLLPSFSPCLAPYLLALMEVKCYELPYGDALLMDTELREASGQ